MLGVRGEIRLGQRETIEEGIGVRKQPLAAVCKPHAVVASLEQPRPDLLLERGHLLGDSGRRKAQGFGGRGEAAAPRDLAKGRQPPSVKHATSDPLRVRATGQVRTWILRKG
jgi:hypothetical protein